MAQGRELWLTLRARDQASSTIRRAARDLRGLDFTGAQAKADLADQQARVASQIRLSELRQKDIQAQMRMTELRQKDYLAQQRSYETGLKANQLELQKRQLLTDVQRRLEREASIEARRLAIQRQQIVAARELVAAQRAASPGNVAQRAVGVSVADLHDNVKIAELRVQELTKAYDSNSIALKVNSSEAKKLIIVRKGLTEAEAEAARMAEKNAALANEQAASMERLAARESEAATATERLRAQQTGLFTTMGKVPVRDWQSLNSSVKSVSHSMLLAGAAATFTLSMMARSAAETSKQLTLAVTQQRRPGEGPLALRADQSRLFDVVLKQMHEFPAASKDMANSLYEIFSSTNIQSIPKAADMMHTFNMMAVAGGTDLKTMTDAGISMFNNFPGQFKDMTQAADQFFAVVRFGRMNAEQFGQSLSFILPIAKAVGMSFMDVGTAMGFLTRQTGAARTRQDAQGLARLIQLFGRREVALGIKQLGVEVFDATGRMRPIIKIIDDIRNHTHMSHEEVLNFFKDVSKQGGAAVGTSGTIQAQRIFDQIYEHPKTALKVAEQIRQDRHEMTKSFQAMIKDPGVKWEIFQSQMRALAISIGRDLIPVFARMGEMLSRLTGWFESLSPHTRRLITDFIAYGAVITFLVGLFGSLITMFAGVGFVIVRLIGYIAELKVASAALGSEAGFISARFGVWGAIITALLIALPILHAHFGGLTGIMGGFNNILLAINAALLVFMVRMIAARAVMIGVNSSMALFLGTIGTPEIVIGTILGAVASHFIRQIPGWDRAMKGLGSSIYSTFHQKTSLDFQMDPAKGVRMARSYYWKLHAAGIAESRANPMFEAHFKGVLDKDLIPHYETIAKTFAAQVDAETARLSKVQGIKPTAGSPRRRVYTDSQFFAEMHQIDKLNQAVEKAPTMKAKLAALKNYNKAVTEAASNETDFQKSVDDNLQQFLQQHRTETATITIKQIKRMAAEYAKMQQQMKVAPTLALATRIQKMDDTMKAAGAATQDFFNALVANMHISDKTATATFQKLHKLQEQFKVAPTLGMAKEIQKLQDVMSQASPAQQAYFQQLEANMHITDAAATTAHDKLRELQAQFRIAPTLALAKEIQKYMDIMAKASPAQQAFFQQLDQLLGDTKSISDSSALAMARNVQRLKDAFDKHPSIAGYQRWYDAQKRFTTMATSDQQQFGNDMVAANKAATDQVAADFKSMTDKIKGMYDDIHSAMVQAFGTLGSGPEITRLNDKVDKIRQAGSDRAQAIRDAAQRIQDAAQQAQTDISASQGNLIDWGLAPSPADTKSQTDAVVKRMNDQADAIEKAANKQADALAKRLAEHKLTPGEILKDLRAQVKAFTDWNNDLEAIQRRGAPQKLMDQLRALGPEFDNMLKGVLKMSPEQFQEYIRLFNKGQKAIDNQTMKQLKSQLKVYQKFGGSIAKAIAAGIEDESPALRKALISLIETTFPGLKVPGGRRPSARTPAGGHTPAVTNTNSNNTTYIYNAGKDGNLSPQAYFTKMHFKHKNHRRC